MILALLLAVASPEAPCFRYAPSAAARELVRRESRGQPTADNPRSSAFGCGQLIRAQRVKYARQLGVHPDTPFADEQMALMSLYCIDRYSTYERALAHHNRKGWY